MLFLLGGDRKKKADKEKKRIYQKHERARELFLDGHFPVSTTGQLDDERKISRVLGLVVCRGFDAEDAFFGMASRAINKGAQAIIGYQENVAFHPDGSRYFTCYGTAVLVEEVRNSHQALP